jgi:hypothetical protein
VRASVWRLARRGGEHLDLLFIDSDGQVAIEFKYLTAAWVGRTASESFELLWQGAQDTRAYDCVKDIALVERYTAATSGSSGLVLVLANDALYWRPVTHGRLTNADAFRIHEGAVLHGDVGGRTPGQASQRPVPLPRLQGATPGV